MTKDIIDSVEHGNFVLQVQAYDDQGLIAAFEEKRIELLAALRLESGELDSIKSDMHVIEMEIQKRSLFRTPELVRQ